ncbi:MAG: hypothetical protein ACI8RD_003600 [Bacillariaceae sp.]|jgi:hypothetical protein
MQAMMAMNQNNNQEKLNGKEATNIPEEFTTQSTEQTSAITTSVVTETSTNTPNGKRSSSLLSNMNEETEMIDKEQEITEEQENIEEAMATKRNKKQTGMEEDEDETGEEDEEMMIDEQQHECVYSELNCDNSYSFERRKDRNIHSEIFEPYFFLKFNYVGE